MKSWPEFINESLAQKYKDLSKKLADQLAKIDTDPDTESRALSKYPKNLARQVSDTYDQLFKVYKESGSKLSFIDWITNQH